MANHKSAIKRIRRNTAFNVINSNRRNRIRSFIKKVEAAIAAGNVEDARIALKEAQPEMHRGVTRGVMPRNMVARKLSRLSARIKALAS